MINHILHLARVAHAVVREHITKVVARSGQWPTVRKHFLSTNPKCQACGDTSHLQVHHKLPFHDDPSLELHPDNLIALCMGKLECHVKIGHGGSFKQYNPNVAADAAELVQYPNRYQEIVVRAEGNRKPNQPGM